nr:NAD(P)/FAD-dependent oxidoreductase [Propionicimonas sp.]
MTEAQYDVVVIGAGAIGSAVARDLAGTSNRVALIEARGDVCEGTSKANTALLCTGFDAKPNSLESRLYSRGYELMMKYCEETGIAVDRCGGVLVAWDEEQAATLPQLQAEAELNGYMESRILSSSEVYALLPELGHGVTAGLEVPGESIIDPWSVPLACATDAVSRGADLHLNCRVESIQVGAEVTTLSTSSGDITTRWVVNSAGLGGDVIDRFYGYDRIHLFPRRGELLVFDKLSASIAPKIVLAVPSKVTKGVLISPTVFGNVMLGPNAEIIEDREDTSTTRDGFDFILEKGRRVFPQLMEEEVTAAYAGLRAGHDQKDCLVERDSAQRYVITAAFRAGLTFALSVAELVHQLLGESDLDMSYRPSLPAPVRVPPLGAKQLRPYEDDVLIAQDSAYGEVVCFCERVTRGEIRDACHSLIPARDQGGLRRRTRVMNGRCQGFFCGAAVKAILDEALASKDDAR